MATKDPDKIADSVHDLNENKNEKPTVDLVFNPRTMEFEQRRAGDTTPTSGMIVTEPSREGFACHG